MPAGAKHVGDGGDLLEAEVPIQARSLKAIRVEEDFPGTALLRLGFDAGEEGACDAATAEALLHEQVLDLHGIRHKVRHDTARELALDRAVSESDGVFFGQCRALYARRRVWMRSSSSSVAGAMWRMFWSSCGMRHS